MKKTGIVRRIDELGRIVIPKEIRKILRLHEGTQMEIYTSDEGELILKKYSQIGEVKSYAENFCKVLADSYDAGVLISDNDKILTVHNLNKKEYLNKTINDDLSKLLQSRKSYYYKSSDTNKIVKLVTDDKEVYTSQVIVPIIASSDVVGSIIMVSKQDESEIMLETVKVMQTLALILGNIIS